MSKKSTSQFPIQDFQEKFPSQNTANTSYYDYCETTYNKQKTRQRRFAKDIDSRDFKCGCGKEYASLAALFTHVKFKHGGQKPRGTTTLKRRGRPSVIVLFFSWLIFKKKNSNSEVLNLSVGG